MSSEIVCGDGGTCAISLINGISKTSCSCASYFRYKEQGGQYVPCYCCNENNRCWSTKPMSHEGEWNNLYLIPIVLFVFYVSYRILNGIYKIRQINAAETLRETKMDEKNIVILTVINSTAKIVQASSASSFINASPHQYVSSRK